MHQVCIDDNVGSDATPYACKVGNYANDVEITMDDLLRAACLTKGGVPWQLAYMGSNPERVLQPFMYQAYEGRKQS